VRRTPGTPLGARRHVRAARQRPDAPHTPPSSRPPNPQKKPSQPRRPPQQNRSHPVKAIIPHDVPELVYNTRYFRESPDRAGSRRERQGSFPPLCQQQLQRARARDSSKPTRSPVPRLAPPPFFPLPTPSHPSPPNTLQSATTAARTSTPPAPSSSARAPRRSTLRRWSRGCR